MYTKRKENIIGKLSKELDILKWKKIFIESILDGKIIIFKQKKSDIIEKLVELKFPKLSKIKDNSIDSIDSINSYDYITDMPLFNLTEEKINELIEKYNNKEQELIKIQTTSEIDQWTYELDEFVDKYKLWFKSNLIDTTLQKSLIPKKLVTNRPVTTIAKSLGFIPNVAKPKKSIIGKKK